MVCVPAFLHLFVAELNPNLDDSTELREFTHDEQGLLALPWNILSHIVYSLFTVSSLPRNELA